MLITGQISQRRPLRSGAQKHRRLLKGTACPFHSAAGRHREQQSSLLAENLMRNRVPQRGVVQEILVRGFDFIFGKSFNQPQHAVQIFRI